MNRKLILVLLLSSLFILLTACSSNDSGEESFKESTRVSNDMAIESESTESSDQELAEEDLNNSNDSNEISTDRMIIHQAQLQLNVKNFEQARMNIEKKVNKYGGYIVESNVYREDEDFVNGHMTVRVPEKHFQTVLTDAEGEAADILERTVTGQDVTEEYVDLESRIKSKRAVEARLLKFMSDAEKTEDLLKISSDLAAVQEEIELIVGQMNYFENQTSFSTIYIAMYENRVIVPGLDSKDLDTWAKTKKQLATSTNFLLAAGSGVIVFIIGNLPIIVLLLLVGGGIYFYVRRKQSK